jgi:predicted nucleic acid-binding protein
MKIVADTPVWSLVLRRQQRHLNAEETRLRVLVQELIRDGRVLMIGPIRQELLSGVRDRAQFQRLREALRPFPDLQLETADFENAAQMSNECSSQGIASSAVDMLICSVARKAKAGILTTDRDFLAYANCLPIHLFQPQSP